MKKRIALYATLTLAAAVFLPDTARSCMNPTPTTAEYRARYLASCVNRTPSMPPPKGFIDFGPCAAKPAEVAATTTASPAANAPEMEESLAALPNLQLQPETEDSADASLNLTLNNLSNYYDSCTSTSTVVAGALNENAIPVVLNRQVEQYINYFQGRGRKHFERWLSRSGEYMAMLQQILKESNMPEDLSYIAFIESGLNPKAKSRAKAVGMWQFIKGTGKRYGLRIDLWVDERMDPEKATYAAASYFRDLYEIFGSWYLAAAGYNAGEGKIIRAVRKLGTEDFWELANHKRPLKKETREYVPKYLAALIIAKDPASYGFDEQVLRSGIEYDKVIIPEATDLKVIAEAADTTVDEIRRLNPELLRWFTPPGQNDYEIKIPKGAKETFAARFAGIPRSERLNFRMHTVKKGETLSAIAKRYRADLKSMLYINNFKNAGRVRPGTVIAVPVPTYSAKSDATEVAKNGYDIKIKRTKGRSVIRKANTEA